MHHFAMMQLIFKMPNFSHIQSNMCNHLFPDRKIPLILSLCCLQSIAVTVLIYSNHLTSVHYAINKCTLCHKLLSKLKKY